MINSIKVDGGYIFRYRIEALYLGEILLYAVETLHLKDAVKLYYRLFKKTGDELVVHLVNIPIYTSASNDEYDKRYML